MKKLLASLLACALSLALLGGALAAPGDALLFVMDQSASGYSYSPQIDTVAALGDTLFMASYESFYAYRIGEAEPTELTYDEASGELVSSSARKLLSDGKALYMLAYGEKGILYEVRSGDGVASLINPLELDWTKLVVSDGEYAYSRSLTDAMFIGGNLYVLCETEDYTGVELFRYDLEEGSTRVYSVRDLYGMCAYKDGYALLTLRNDENWEASTRLAMMDLTTGDVKDLATFPDGKGGIRADGLVYDADADIIYYLLNGALYAWKLPEEAQMLSAAPIQSNWRGLTGQLLDGGYYAYGNYNGVVIRNTDPALKASRTLTIQGYSSMDKAYQAFTASHPDVDVLLDTSYSADDAITQAMINGSDAVDIYSLDVGSTSFASMLGRGYAADLSGSAMIAETIGQMYPHIRETISKDGKILAVPTSYNAYGWGYHPGTLEKLGLTEEDLPTTYQELCDLLNRWPDEFGANFPEKMLLEPYMIANARSSMLYQLLTDYMMYMSYTGQQMQFNTPMFRQALASIEGIDQSLYPSMDENEGYSYSTEDLLIETYYSVTLGEGAYYRDANVLDMALADDAPALYRGNMSVYLVNPYSKNIDLAIEYLACKLENTDPLLMANLIPTLNDPIPNPNYEKMLASYRESLEQIRKTVESSEEADKQYYESILADQENYGADLEKRWKWLASEEDIAAYRAAAERIVISTSEMVAFYGEQGQEIASFLERYINGQISADQMLSGIDQKLRMMQMESAY